MSSKTAFHQVDFTYPLEISVYSPNTARKSFNEWISENP